MSDEQPIDPNKLAGELFSQILRSRCEAVGHMAMEAYAHGFGTSLFLSMRDRENPQLGAFLMIGTGNFTPQDLATLKDTMDRVMQDATSGAKFETFANENTMDGMTMDEKGVIHPDEP